VEAERAQAELRAALTAADDASASPVERAEMLMEIAMGLQQRPKSPEQLVAAVALYDRALSICPETQPLLRARIQARKGTALQAIPGEGTEALENARTAHEEALLVLRERGKPEELAEVEMNLGLVIQTLAAAGRARMTDAIAAYQRSLRTFDKARFPREFAILQNNLATAFLSMAVGDATGKMREAMAVAAFEEGLRAVTLIDHPGEYAMLQNNLGNALQYASSSHMVENNLRALEAYDEALKVRTREAMPLEYANTIANRANCLRNLPDDTTVPRSGNRKNLLAARAAYAEVRAIFASHGEPGKARIAGEAGEQIDREMLAEASDA
jgi:tetratricopeptide (TPR) repeat protein